MILHGDIILLNLIALSDNKKGAAYENCSSLPKMRAACG